MIRHTSVLHKDLSGLGVTISPADNVPLHQIFDEETQSYIPDHSLIPLILVPELQYEGADVSAEYEERGWWRINASGAEEQITASTPGHTLYPSGYPLGLKISANLPSSQCWKYVFRVKAKGVRGSDTVTLRTNMAASAIPTVELDCPSALNWDPFVTGHDTLVITPLVHPRGKSCTVRWRKIENGIKRTIVYTDYEDLELSLPAYTPPSGSSQLTTYNSQPIAINRRWMGDSVSLVCELLVAATIMDEKYVTVNRRVPPHRDGILANTFFGAGDTIHHAKIQVFKEPGGLITDPSAELKIDWYDCDTSSPVFVGSGNTHDFPLSSSAAKKNIAVEVTDRGPWCCLQDSSGNYITDSSGAVLLAR